MAGRPDEARIGRVRMGFGEYESMKSRETLIRLKKFQVDEKRRRVAQIESMIADSTAWRPTSTARSQPSRSAPASHDPAHFAYPTYAKAADRSGATT